MPPFIIARSPTERVKMLHIHDTHETSRPVPFIVPFFGVKNTRTNPGVLNSRLTVYLFNSLDAMRNGYRAHA
jgi:hypothetical protein